MRKTLTVLGSINADHVISVPYFAQVKIIKLPMVAKVPIKQWQPLV